MQADRNVIYKHAAKEIASAQGKSVTFMAKWDESMAGSSMHVHVSSVESRRRRPPSPARLNWPVRGQRHLPLVPRRLDAARPRAHRLLRAVRHLL